MTLIPGQKLGPYEILAAAGTGGMGEVYKARDTRLERTVAIKVLPGISQENASIRQRFEREAKSISSLNHPNICTLFDVGHQDGIDYLVMEYLDGETLSSRLTKGAIPQPELFTLAIQIADALDNAHRQGLVHRDLKPGNVMLTKTGAKLMDFGLAKLHHGGGVVTGTDRSTRTTPLTGEGAIIGTLQYMSPEQLEGKEADQRSDIFAFGAVLYEMATGQKAFKGSSQASLIASIMMQEPISGTTLQALSPPLERLVRKCLAKNPDDRWQTARDLKDELQWISGGGGTSSTALVTGQKIKLVPIVSIVAVAAIITVVVLAVSLLNRTTPPEQTVRFSIPPDSTQSHVWSPRISPDGTKLAYLALDEKQNTRFIFVRPLNSLESYKLASTAGAVMCFWSPDSKYLAFLEVVNMQVKKVSVTGGPAQLICETIADGVGTWGKGGDILFFYRTVNVIQRVSASGGAVTNVSSLDTAAGETEHGFPLFLPDGRHFLYLTSVRGVTDESIDKNYMVKVGTLDGQGTKTLFLSDSRIEYDPAGFILYAKDSTLMARRFDAEALEIIGEPFQTAVRIGGDVMAQFSVSNDGVLTYIDQFGIDRWTQRQLCWLDRKGNVISVVGDTAAYRGVRLSHDEKKIAYVVQDDSSGTDIWIRDLERKVSSRIAYDTVNERCPLWSADDKTILFAYDGKGTTELHTKSVSGLGGEKSIATIKEIDVLDFYPQGWSSDGQTILLMAFEWKNWFNSNKANIYWFNLRTDSLPKPFLSEPFYELLPALSPDNRFMAYVSNQTGEKEVYVVSLDSVGEKLQITDNGGGSPMWSKDGKELFFTHRGDTTLEVWSVPVNLSPTFKVGIPAKLFQHDIFTSDPTYSLWRYDVTADGQRFIVDRALPQSEENTAEIHVVLNWSAEIEKK